MQPPQPQEVDPSQSQEVHPSQSQEVHSSPPQDIDPSQSQEASPGCGSPQLPSDGGNSDDLHETSLHSEEGNNPHGRTRCTKCHLFGHLAENCKVSILLLNLHFNKMYTTSVVISF